MKWKKRKSNTLVSLEFWYYLLLRINWHKFDNKDDHKVNRLLQLPATPREKGAFMCLLINSKPHTILIILFSKVTTDPKSSQDLSYNIITFGFLISFTHNFLISSFWFPLLPLFFIGVFLFFALFRQSHQLEPLYSDRVVLFPL